MSKQRHEVPVSQAGALTHNPFAKLSNTHAPKAPVPSTVARDRGPKKPSPPQKLRCRLESKGRSGKVVTRVTGLPEDNLNAIAARLRKALGCGATIEGPDLLVLGSLVDRVTAWLESIEDLRTILPESTPTAPKPQPAPSAQPKSAGSGTVRQDIRRGQRVAIVTKADQSSGKMTEGVVQDILTNSPDHPRGIKVRLETGEVGRVQAVWG